MKSNSHRFSRSEIIGFDSNYNNRVLIKIPIDTGDFWQKEYNQNDLIGQIARDFKSDNHIDTPDDYFIDFYFQNKELKLNDPIKSLMNYEIPTLYINQIIKKKPLKLNLGQEYIYPDLVGRPYFQPFEVFLFSREDKSLKIQLYDEDIINNLFLNEFCSSSAYCNGNNHLFISGGERDNGELIDNFWEIDLKEQIIAEPVKIIPKKNHSMIFIPDKYVFIVGGNDKKCIYFNTETAEVDDWSDLNKIRVEPALQLVKNYLYCFDSINYRNNEKFTIEKTDLDSFKPKWILLQPKMDMILGNKIILNQESFGVSKDEENNIIFVGGNINEINEKFNFKYNTGENMIEISKIPFNKYKLKEKTFLPFKKNIDFILPDFEKENPEVIFFIKNKNKIEIINYQPKQEPKQSIKKDFKYDFNMPKLEVASNSNFEQDNFNYLSNSNHENNGSNYNNINNITNNININNQIPITFEEPEIEPAKEDLKLNLEIKDNNLLVNDNINDLQTNKKEETELNGLSLNSNIKEDDKEKNISINLTNNLKNIDLTKDFNICGTILGTKSYKINGDINANMNLKDEEIKKENININKELSEIKENNNFSTDVNIKCQTNNLKENIPQVNINSSKNIYSNTKSKILGSKIEIDTKKSTMPDYNLSGHIPGVKKTIYINSNNKNNENKKNEKNNESKKIDKTKEFNISGIIKGKGKKSNVKEKNINDKKNIIEDKNIFTGIIKGNKSNITQKEKKLSIPKLDLEGKIPEISDSNIDINTKPHMIDLKKDSNANISYEINKNSPTFQINGNNFKNENTIELNGDNNNYSLNNGNIQGSKIELSSFDNMNFKEFKVEQKNLNQRKINLNNQEEININVNIPNESINPKFAQSSSNNNNIYKGEMESKNPINTNIIISGIIPGTEESKLSSINTQINYNQNIKVEPNKMDIIQNGNVILENNNDIYKSPNNNDNNAIMGKNTYLMKNGNYINFKNNNKQTIKNNNLPLVGSKNDNFISSKVEPVKNIDAENININNLKSSNSGINGVKNGERIIK